MVFGYSRVSSEEQAAHGISISAQRDILNGYAAMHQEEIRIFEDAGYSGKNTERPALREMLSVLKKERPSSIVVWKLDRLSRSLRDTLTMIEDVFQPCGASLVSVTESIDTSTPSGRMMLNMLASFAQLEREQDSDRVVMAHKHLARDCRYLGGHVPLGYSIDDDGYYQLDPATAPIVRHVFELYIGRFGYTDILEYVNSQPAALSRRKKPFGKSDLKYMLHNEFYNGTYIRRMGQDKRSRITAPEVIRVPGGVPAIISMSDWRKVEVIRDENKAAHTGAMYRTSSRVHPLTGLVYCAICKGPMRLEYAGKDRDGTVQRYYTCKNKDVKPVRLEKAEAAVFAAVDALLLHEDEIKRACAIANEYSANTELDNRAECSDLEKELRKINKQIARLVDFLKKNGSDAPNSIMEEIRSLEKQQSEIKAKIVEKQKPFSRCDAKKTVESLKAIKEAKNWPPEKQKSVIQAAIRRVLVSQSEIQVLPTGIWDVEMNRHVLYAIFQKGEGAIAALFFVPLTRSNHG